MPSSNSSNKLQLAYRTKQCDEQNRDVVPREDTIITLRNVLSLAETVSITSDLPTQVSKLLLLEQTKLQRLVLIEISDQLLQAPKFRKQTRINAAYLRIQ